MLHNFDSILSGVALWTSIITTTKAFLCSPLNKTLMHLGYVKHSLNFGVRVQTSVGSSIEQLDARSCSLGKLHARARSVLEKIIFFNARARSMLELYARKCSTSNFYIDLAVFSPYIAFKLQNFEIFCIDYGNFFKIFTIFRPK